MFLEQQHQPPRTDLVLVNKHLSNALREENFHNANNARPKSEDWGGKVTK